MFSYATGYHLLVNTNFLAGETICIPLFITEITHQREIAPFIPHPRTCHLHSYGDHLYDRGEYDKAAEQYKNTIGA